MGKFINDDVWLITLHFRGKKQEEEIFSRYLILNYYCASKEESYKVVPLLKIRDYLFQ